MREKITLIVGLSIVIILFIVSLLILNSCGNMQLVDTTYNFKEAIVFLPNGELVRGKVDSWADFENSDMVQVKIGGVTYLTHSSNVVMVTELKGDLK